MKIAITGSTGFVGRAIVRAGMNAGHEFLELSAPRLHSAAWAETAVLRDLSDRQHSECELHFEGAETLINAAGIARPGAGRGEELVGANAILPGVLARAAASAGVRRFVHISTAGVYGRAQVLDEKVRPAPETPYGMTKLWGEQAATSAVDLEVAILRPTSVHGAGRAVTKSLRKFACSRFSSIAGRGCAPTPQVLVQSVADAALFLAAHPVPPPYPVIQPSGGLTTAQLLRTLSDRDPVAIPEPVAVGLVKAAYLVGAPHPRLRAIARRLDMVWFGQPQAPGWLESAGFRANCDWPKSFREAEQILGFGGAG